MLQTLKHNFARAVNSDIAPALIFISAISGAVGSGMAAYNATHNDWDETNSPHQTETINNFNQRIDDLSILNKQYNAYKQKLDSEHVVSLSNQEISETSKILHNTEKEFKETSWNIAYDLLTSPDLSEKDVSDINNSFRNHRADYIGRIYNDDLNNLNECKAKIAKTNVSYSKPEYVKEVVRCASYKDEKPIISTIFSVIVGGGLSLLFSGLAIGGIKSTSHVQKWAKSPPARTIKKNTPSN